MLYNIELGKFEDLDKIVKLNSKVFKVLDKKEFGDLNYYHDLLSKKKYLIFLSFEGKRLIGSMIAIERGKNYHILMLGISEDDMKRGIGKKMLELSEKVAKQGKKYKALSITVYDNQEELLKLLEERKYSLSRKNSKEKFKDYKKEL